MGQRKRSYTGGGDAKWHKNLRKQFGRFFPNEQILIWGGIVIGLQRNWADNTEFPSTPTDSFFYYKHLISVWYICYNESIDTDILLIYQLKSIVYSYFIIFHLSASVAGSHLDRTLHVVIKPPKAPPGCDSFSDLPCFYDLDRYFVGSLLEFVWHFSHN